MGKVHNVVAAVSGVLAAAPALAGIEYQYTSGLSSLAALRFDDDSNLATAEDFGEVQVGLDYNAGGDPGVFDTADSVDTRDTNGFGGFGTSRIVAHTDADGLSTRVTVEGGRANGPDGPRGHFDCTGSVLTELFPDGPTTFEFSLATAFSEAVGEGVAFGMYANVYVDGVGSIRSLRLDSDDGLAAASLTFTHEVNARTLIEVGWVLATPMGSATDGLGLLDVQASARVVPAPGSAWLLAGCAPLGARRRRS